MILLEEIMKKWRVWRGLRVGLPIFAFLMVAYWTGFGRGKGPFDPWAYGVVFGLYAAIISVYFARPESQMKRTGGTR